MITRNEAYDLSGRNTFGMKVSCRLYVEVTDPEDLLTLDFAALPQPLFVMGGGSNLLFISDFPGTVLHLANVGLTVIPGEAKESGNREGNVIPGLTGNLLVRAGAGVVFDDFCAWVAQEGLWGPENLSLIPGEVGASAVQNIGAYGVEAKDIIETVHAFDLLERRFVDIPGADCAYGYRTSRFKTDWKGRYIITAVTFRLSTVPQPKLDYGGVRKALEDRGKGVPSRIASASLRPLPQTSSVSPEDSFHPADPKSAGPSLLSGRGWPEILEGTPFPLSSRDIRETIIEIRRKKLPDPEEIGSAGSFFCNPVISREHFERIVATAREDNGPEYEVPHYDVGENVKVPAAWMIDQCGFKGAREGGAQVYPNQPLVIVNATGNATPEEVVALERRIIDTIREKYGVELHPEVEHIGAQSVVNQLIK